MEIIEILHPLGQVQCNSVSEWKDSGPYKVSLNCSVHPGGVVNIILFPSDDLFGGDSKQQLVVVKTKNNTVALSKAVFDAADKTAVKQPHDIKQPHDAKYTGGAQPTPPAQQAADKPKDYPWASSPLPEGEHTHTIEVLIVAPQMKEGVHRSYTNQSGKTSYKYDVAYVLDGFRRKATWESASSSDPMLPLGQHQMVITVKGNFASIKKPRSGNGFGGGSAPADPKLTLLAGIVSNPTIPADKWGASLKHALEVLGGSK